jgi:hypothetical protein
MVTEIQKLNEELDLKKVKLHPRINLFNSKTQARIIAFNPTFASGDSYYAKSHYVNLFDEIKKNNIVIFPSSFYLHEEENKPFLYLSNICSKIYIETTDNFYYPNSIQPLELCVKEIKEELIKKEIKNVGFSLMDSYQKGFQKLKSQKFNNTLDSKKVIKTIDEIFEDYKGSVGIYNIK